MILARHALRLVVREPRRSLAALVGTVIAAAQITSVLLFGSASGATVTRRALADLPVDAQVILSVGANVEATKTIVGGDPAVRNVVPFDLAHFDTAASDRAGTATQTSTGVIVGVDAAYVSATGLFQASSGTIAKGQVAISRDLASNLGVVAGDSITFSLPGGKSVKLKVSGIVSIAGADLVLGPIDAAHRAAGANPPTNVAVMQRADLESLVLSLIPAGVVAADPGTTSPGGAPVPSAGPVTVSAAEVAVRRELHLQLAVAQIPGDPAAAQLWLDTVRRRMEIQGAGTFQVVDDAQAALEPIASDLAWGQILFIFLALPGIILALVLSRLAADATADTTRRHVALLRARGAGPRDLRLVFGGATVLTALVGSAIGALIGALIGLVLFGGLLGGGDAVAAAIRAALIATGLTTILASFAAILPLRGQLREEIAAGRQQIQRARQPLWQRLYLDVVALIGAVAVDLLVGGQIRPVINTEGVTTVSLALTSFVAPLLFWIGGTLLLLRILGRLTPRTGRLAAGLGRLLGPGGQLAGRSIAARSSAASRAIVVLGLAISFATSVLIFNATYLAQQRVDAELTLGADLKAVPNAPTDASAISALAGPGIASVTPFVDRVVYVGPEAQDLLGIDPAGLTSVSPLADSFFQGSTATAAMDALKSRPDAILVSAETAKDYSIVPGDRIRIRVPDAAGVLKTVDFHMAGIALEFPTAPKDAFLVANLAYVAAQTGDSRVSFALARAGTDIGDAARRLAARAGPGWQVSDLSTTTARLANSITSVDLQGVVLIDLAFGVLIAAVGTALFLLAGLAERRRELATLVAVGGEPGQLRASLVGETLIVGVSGLAIGLLTGALVGLAFLQILAGIFDPPANLPVLPIAAIVATAGCVAAALVLAVALADRGISRLDVVGALRER